jgi:predicted nucleotidyltransferase
MDKENPMLIYNALDRVFDHKLKTGILRILCKESAGLTGRQLARLLTASPTTINKFLNSLKEDGVVKASSAGKAYLYSLNTDSYIVKVLVKPFFEKEKSILPAVTALIKKAVSRPKATVETVAIFGSVARRREGPKSDIDLIVVLGSVRDKEKVEESLDLIADAVARDFQTAIVPYVLSIDQFKRRHKDNEPIVKEILSAYILVQGRPLERLVI